MICILLCSVFRRYNRLISGRLSAQRRRASLLFNGGGVLISTLSTKDRERAEDASDRPYIGAAHPGLQSSEAASEEDTDFRELQPRGIESEQILSYRGGVKSSPRVFERAAPLTEPLLWPSRREI